MNIVFMGTPDFAVPPLKALIDAGHSILMVVTQPDRQKGRGRAIASSPVKQCAEEYGIPVLQPEKIRAPEAVEALRACPADVYVVAAFGQILPPEVLELPAHGCINIHASLLPTLRGAAPIQQAILEGHARTGITIMRMDEGCDTGDILLQAPCPIEARDTAGTLFDKLAALGAETIVRALTLLQEGALTPVPQDPSLATHAQKMTPATGQIRWTERAVFIERLIRATDPWPGAVTFLEGKRMKICEARIADREVPRPDGALPGTILSAIPDGLFVLTGDGVLQVTALQAEGGRRMTVKDYLLGHTVTSGQTFDRR